MVDGATTTQTHYVFDQAGHLLAEHDGATGAVRREYVWLDDMPVAMIDSTGASPAIYYLHTGQLDEPVTMTDAAGNTAWDGFLEPFGQAQVFGAPSVDLRLPGQFAEAESGLFQNWNRDYDPSLGRYIEADPLGIEAGQNVYGYVDGDPLSDTDSLGLFLFPWEKPYTIRGGTPLERAQIAQLMSRIDATHRGAELHRMIVGPWWWHGQPFTICVSAGQSPGFDTKHRVLVIDPTIHPLIMTTAGLQRASTARILGHEYGHAATGDADSGPERLLNVIENENPIARQLGETFDRVRY